MFRMLKREFLGYKKNYIKALLESRTINLEFVFLLQIILTLKIILLSTKLFINKVIFSSTLKFKDTVVSYFLHFVSKVCVGKLHKKKIQTQLRVQKSSFRHLK